MTRVGYSVVIFRVLIESSALGVVREYLHQTLENQVAAVLNCHGGGSLTGRHHIIQHMPSVMHYLSNLMHAPVSLATFALLVRSS